MIALLMLCSCNSEPEEIERELNGEVTRGTFEGGFYYDFENEKRIDFEGEHPIGSAYVKEAVYHNSFFEICNDHSSDSSASINFSMALLVDFSFFA